MSQSKKEIPLPDSLDDHHEAIDVLVESVETKEYNKEEASPTYSGFDAVTPYQIELQKKVPKVQYLIFILSFVSMFSGLVNDAYTPAILEMSKDFQVDSSLIQALIGYYLIGLGLGQLFWGPFVDRFGRKLLVVLCSLLGILTNLAFISTTDYSHLVTIRVLQGFVFSGLGVVPQIILKDIFSPRQFVVINSWMITIFLFAPAAAPLFGGYISLHLHWEWIFNIISILVFLTMLLFIAVMPETLDPEKKQPFNTKRILSNYSKILFSPKAVLLIVINSLFSVSIFSFPTLLPAIYIEDFHVPSELFGYYTFAMVFVVIAGIQANQFFIRKGFSPLKIWIVASVLQSLVVFVNIAVVFTDSLSVISIILALSTNVLFNGFQLGNMFVIYLVDYQHMTGTATSLLTSIRLLASGAIVGWISHFDRHMGGTLLLSNVALIWGCTLLSLLFFLVYGKKMMKCSKPQGKPA